MTRRSRSGCSRSSSRRSCSARRSGPTVVDAEAAPAPASRSCGGAAAGARCCSSRATSCGSTSSCRRRGCALWASATTSRASMVWLGDARRRGAGCARRRAASRSTRGLMACSAWCPLVCFAGIGPGEVLARRRQAGRHQPAPHPGGRPLPVRRAQRLVAGRADSRCSPATCPAGDPRPVATLPTDDCRSPPGRRRRRPRSRRRPHRGERLRAALPRLAPRLARSTRIGPTDVGPWGRCGGREVGRNG